VFTGAGARPVDVSSGAYRRGFGADAELDP